MNKYRPSNGTEGEYFISKYCQNCIHGKYEHTGDINDKPCEILSKTFFLDIDDKGYPEEWIKDESGHGKCTAFVKFDWDKDDDGNWIDPPPPPTDDPNQLCLPFIFDELKIKQIETSKTSCRMA